MRPVLSQSGSSSRVRFLAAGLLVAMIAIGAPLHSHDVAFHGDQPSPQKATCAACVTSANPGLALERTEIVHVVEAVGTVSVPEFAAVALPLPVRSGRAPPIV